MSTDVIHVLKSCALFNSFEDSFLSHLSRSVEVKKYDHGTYIFKQGQKSLQSLFIVASGQGEVTITDNRGQELVVSVRQQYDFFSEIALLTDKSYVASVRAVGELTCLLIPRAIVEHILATYPQFSGKFTALLSERMRMLYEERASHQSYEGGISSESPLLRKRVSELMKAFPVTCQIDESVTRVASLLAEYRISSVVVVKEGYPIGLITEKDLVHKVLTRPSWQVEKLTACQLMGEKLVKIRAGDFYYEALLKMVKHQVKHMIVMDEDNLAGILTLGDLVKTRSTGSLWAADKIETAKNLKELAKTGQEVGNFLNALVAERASVPELFEIVTELHDRLVCRVIEFCQGQMLERGYGPPPVEYCWINMGSAGRREQTLRTDQDNAIIYADGNPGSEKYFHALGLMVAEELVEAGFAWCKGGTMASNPLWCRSLNNWKDTVAVWIRQADPEQIRLLSILLDFRPVYGEVKLAGELWEFVLESFKTPLKVTHYLASEELAVRVPLTIFGGFATEKKGPQRNEINLKHVCRHIINCVRIFSVKNMISETSTLGRLALILEKGILPAEDVEFVQSAFEILMMLRIRENLRKVKQGKEPDNYINPYKLSKFEQSMVKNAFSAITLLQKHTGSQFRI